MCSHYILWHNYFVSETEWCLSFKRFASKVDELEPRLLLLRQIVDNFNVFSCKIKSPPQEGIDAKPEGEDEDAEEDGLADLEVNFISILKAAFMRKDPQKHKRH